MSNNGLAKSVCFSESVGRSLSGLSSLSDEVTNAYITSIINYRLTVVPTLPSTDWSTYFFVFVEGKRSDDEATHVLLLVAK